MKRITRKAGRKNQHESLHVSCLFDLNYEIDRAALLEDTANKPSEMKARVIFELTEEINIQLRFIESKLDGQTFVDGYNIDYGKFHHSILKNETLRAVPYLTFASSCVWRLNSVRYDLLNREVDELTLSLVDRMIGSLRDAACRAVAEFENGYLAGQARTSEASAESKKQKQFLIDLVTPWKVDYEHQGWSQKRIADKISQRLRDEHAIERQPNTIGSWFGYSKNLK